MKVAWNKARDIKVGERFGTWEVIAESFVAGQKTRVMCRCECGAIRPVLVTLLLRGKASRCHGCAVSTHRQTYSPTWQSWSSMHTRCYNQNSDQYPLYGARGVKVCDEWRNFEQFAADMGDRPDGMTIDRIDTDGDYTKENCRWATPKTQAENRRTTRWVEYEGKQYSATALAKHLGINYATIIGRIKRGAKLDEPVKENQARARKHKPTGADRS